MIELELIGVRVELPANQPILLLKEKHGRRYLPIWIGAAEATAIAFALQGVETQRPLTHDLLVDVLDGLEVELEAIHVTAMIDRTYHAELHLRHGDDLVVVSSRTSDAVAIAARMEDVPIFGADEVLEEAGVEMELDDDGDGEADPDEALAQFRDFLDSVSAEDFREGS